MEAQDSAFPYHDWNERITAECYGTNAFSRILDEQGRIRRILSNYREISFNFGPTLLSWLQGSQPGIYEAILQADAESMRERSGHGNAIAQCYNHVIMPLASHRDKLTQVAGAWRTSATASAGSPRACGFPRRPWMYPPWRCWPRRV